MFPHFQNGAAFFSMGGYGFYVWSAYASVLVGLVIIAGTSLFQFRAQKKRLAKVLKSG